MKIFQSYDHKCTAPTSHLLYWMYTVSQKNCANLFLSELRQIYTTFDNIWQKDGKEARIIWDALIFHLI